jgi:hypothetical protein
MIDFRKQSFLEKKASVSPAAVGRMIENLKDAGKVLPDMSNLKIYTDAERMQKQKELWSKDGTGSFPLDILIGATKLLPKNWNVHSTIEDKVYQLKQLLDKADTNAGSFLAGKDPNSIRGKVFSVKRNDPFGEVVNDNVVEELYLQGNRRPSLLAPVSNTVAMATPLLAAGYLTDKLLLQPNQNDQQQQSYPPQGMYQTAYEPPNQLEKFAYKNYTNEDKNDIMEESVWRSLDKQASIQKIAKLEQEIEKIAAYAQDLKQENELLSKVAMEEKMAREQISQEIQKIKKESLTKQAEAEEFRLRTVARERSKHVVKLAEDMLEKGLIKQADFDHHVDRLMTCDETTLNLYANMTKQASDGEDGLASLALLREYNNMDSKGSVDTSKKGLNKAGQTMGEAARYLLDKQI